MTIQFDLRFRDYLVFSCWHQFLSGTGQSVYLLVTLFVVSTISTGYPLPVVLFFSVVIYAALWVFQLSFMFIQLIVGKHKTLLTQHKVSLEHDGIAIETRYLKALFFWPGIVRIVRRPGFIAIYTQAHSAIVIPSRAFASATEQSAFLSKLAEMSSSA